jgi:hypothetical protein
MKAVRLCVVVIFAASVATAQDQQQPQSSVPGVYLPDEQRALVQSSPACPNDICPGLGNGFYLPSVNSRSINTGGRIFFLNRNLGDCAVRSDVKQNTRDFVSSDSMQRVVTQSMAEANLSGSYSTGVLSMKATAQAMTGYASEVTTTFHSTHMEINVVSSSIDFQNDSRCFSGANLDPTMLTRFRSLALIDTGGTSINPSSWNPYVQFLTDQGSHIMMQQQIGSRFQQWDSSSSTASDIARTLQIKACAQAEGTQAGGGWSVASCSSYSKEEKEEAMRTETEHRRLILGGTDLTRNEVTKELSKKTLDAFIDASKDGNQAIRFIFKPIWQLLYAIYEPDCAAAGRGSAACQNLQRAVNLEAAYEGWTAIGCPNMSTSRGGFYQKMHVAGESTLGIQTYVCYAAKTGCQSNDDCHLGGAGSVCFCYGASCIDQGDAIRGTSLYRNRVRGNQEGSYNQGVNNSCSYKFLAHCDCDTRWAGGLPERTLYLQSAPGVIF